MINKSSVIFSIFAILIAVVIAGCREQTRSISNPDGEFAIYATITTLYVGVFRWGIPAVLFALAASAAGHYFQSRRLYLLLFAAAAISMLASVACDRIATFPLRSATVPEIHAGSVSPIIWLLNLGQLLFVFAYGAAFVASILSIRSLRSIPKS